MNAYFTAMKSYLHIYAVNTYQLRKMRTSWQLCINSKLKDLLLTNIIDKCNLINNIL